MTINILKVNVIVL